MSFYTVPNSASVSEVSSAPPSPISSNTASPGNAPKYGVVVPNRVFVGGIASNTTEIELQELFSQYGTIKDIKIISDRGGVCKGYGFVTFETEEEAKKVQHQPDTIVLKERRLNIAPAVMKQQPFGRPYDAAPPAGALLYHNGTTYTYQNGMAFFAASSPAQSPYSVGASREPPMYAAPFGPGQSTPAPAYPQLLYSQYAAQPMPYLAAAGQQYQYPMQLDYFKTIGPSPSPYNLYAPTGGLNGAMNNAMNGAMGNSSQSSQGYGQPATNHNGPPSGHPMTNTTPGSAYYHTGGELYYNGGNHSSPMAHPQHQPMYPLEASPAHSEDWCPEPRLTHTPVVSLLKLHEEGSVEELEITRTPKKSNGQPPMYPSGPGGPRPRSRRPAPSPGRGRGSSLMGNLAGQRSTSNPHLSSNPSSCLHRTTSLSPSSQVPPVYSGGRSHQAQHHAMQQNQQGYPPRRGGNSMRNPGHKNHSGNPRSSSSHSYNPAGSQNSHVSNGTSKTLSLKNQGEAVNGLKAATSDALVSSAPSTSSSNSVVKKLEKNIDEGGAGDGPTVRHTLPLSPPNTPLPGDTSATTTPATGSGGGDGNISQKMESLSL